MPIITPFPYKKYIRRATVGSKNGPFADHRLLKGANSVELFLSFAVSLLTFRSQIVYKEKKGFKGK